MIIKELRIDSFGAIVKKNIKFDRGINVIYGENEAGKSTIEAFIRSMLYGFSKRRGKGEGDRKRFLPLQGGRAQGELVYEHNNKTYIIKRCFGETKKEDKSIILDYLTGEEIDNINLVEPGKDILGVNRSTFEKTLFISQLGVVVVKDKEEEIMDKLIAVLGCGEHEVPAAKAIENLENLKKGFVTKRGVGTLDDLKKRYSLLMEERYKGYKIAEENLQLEYNLLNEKEHRDKLYKDINRLEVYKKYIKKIKLQKEYKDITNYLKKSEELKREEEELNSHLTKGQDIIDENFIDSLKNENISYLNLRDRREELKEEFNKISVSIREKNECLEKYKYLRVGGNNVREKILNLKYEQKNLEDKLSYLNSIMNSLEEDERSLKVKENSIVDIKKMKWMKDDIEKTLKSYEEKLIEIRDLVDEDKLNEDIEQQLKNERIKLLVYALSFIVGILFLRFNAYVKICGIIIIIVSGYLMFRSYNVSKNFKVRSIKKKKLDSLKEKITEVEEELNYYVGELNLDTYKDLIIHLRRFYAYKEFKDRLNIRIEEKKKIINDEKYDVLIEKYNKNINIINEFLRLSSCEDIEDIFQCIDDYENLRAELEILNQKRSNIEENINMLNFQINEKEDLIREKLSIMNLELGNLLDIDIYIKEYKEKILKKNEIHSNLLSMEETYKALLKDRDIEKIKEELKSVLSEDNKYSYESEEEIESEEKKKSKEIIECEKLIKDIENKIATSFIGRRDIVSIEEEIERINDKIKIEEKNVKAIEMALENLNESFGEVRREIGPTLNNNIGEIFKSLTGEKYDEIKLGQSYEMMIRGDGSLFNSNYLSNGAIDQLYLSLRLAIIKLLFNKEEYPIILDDAFVQYDNTRRRRALKLISDRVQGQGIIFTCHTLEGEILKEENIKFNLIEI